jgi:hypothetical protein
MAERRSLLLICLALGLLAAGLRFYRLGDWPFHGDELATIDEAQSLMHAVDGPLTNQADRLPRLIPLSYFLHYLDHELFGRDEFGTRVLNALLGTLHVVIVFLLLGPSLGRVPALATALLIALWPEHVYRSQENRFYMTAAVLSSLCMLAGALAVRRRSTGWALFASLAAIGAILAHTLQGLVFAGLFLAILIAGRIGGNHRVNRLLLVVVASAVGMAVFSAGYLLPLVLGWNSGETWGYSLQHSVMASISQLGWPVALLAFLGVVAVWKQKDEQSSYWAVWAVVWMGASLALPFLVSYHPGYVFPLTLGALVLAGLAISSIYEGLRQHNAAAAYAWIGLTCLFNLPSLVSHYADGSRLDLRTPAEFVSRQWQPGDRVSTFSPRLFRHYAAPGIETIGMKISDPVADIQKLARGPERLWIVVPSTRTGKPPALADWLGKHCSLELYRRSQRIDYHENITEVYLYVPPLREAIVERKDNQEGIMFTMARVGEASESVRELPPGRTCSCPLLCNDWRSVWPWLEGAFDERLPLAD